ncbi:tRNA (cmo5U34)-methyltransferase [Daejeonella rubra]|uniref:tRNA (Cmo5U34)-methyltransferase n=1 Tax=Daejeonella rubra TaxID=990371 RepID=A0A1G9TLZ3_9SPHI|nr:class I SAM-dependent methyltransferase [Daejeonella rubra]SDM48558.1 tRNA (cmo5U34)-methyltransferase [Daejeonella rubra]
MENVEEFYDQLSSSYTDLIKKCVPRYDELLSNMFLYLQPDFKPLRILDLGCGTGNLTQRILEHFPDAKIDVLDLSEDILHECMNRFDNKSNINYLQADFKSMNLPGGTYDLVMSSIAIHHVEDPFKFKLYTDVFQSLKMDGLFIFADQTRGITDEIYFKNIECWKAEALKLGSTEENWKMWMAHQDAHDFHSPVGWHLENLQKAGFNEVDLLSKYLMWGVFWAKKI